MNDTFFQRSYRRIRIFCCITLPLYLLYAFLTIFVAGHHQIERVANSRQSRSGSIDVNPQTGEEVPDDTPDTVEELSEAAI